MQSFDEGAVLSNQLFALVLLFYHRPKGGGFEANTLSMKLPTKSLVRSYLLILTWPVFGKKCNSWGEATSSLIDWFNPARLIVIYIINF